MRFAYIDSQGNEIAIPSVDALALRIELGAITPDTQLYDEQADHWGPAESHEIFHTLSRAKDEEGFVAPPPVAPAPPRLADEPEEAEAEEPTEEPVAQTTEEPVAEPTEEHKVVFRDEDLAPRLEAPAEAESALLFEVEAEIPTEVEAEVSAEGEQETDLPAQPSSIFDLAEENRPEADAEGEHEGGDRASPDDLDLDVGPSIADLPGPSAVPEVEEDELALSEHLDTSPLDSPAPDVDEEEDEGAFDFGDMGSLELETPEPATEEEASMSFGDGMDLDQPLADTMDFVPGGGGIELESPVADIGSDSAPAWMEQEGPSGADEEDSGALTLDEPAEAEADAPPASEGEDAAWEGRRPSEPRTRPSPPRRPKKSKTPIIMGAVAVVVVGVGGFFGWKAISSVASRPDPEGETPALPAVVIPDIPAELLPIMRDFAESALSEMMSELRGMQGEFDLQAEPRSDWLSGAYLGTASQFGDVEQYWLGIEAFVDRLRSVDRQVFHDIYVAQVETAGIAADTAAMLVERADSGFLAAREDRFEAYNKMDDLVNAALDLHVFLVDNEPDIIYEPAAGGISRDPVLEAVPSSAALGDDMWGMVDNITDALDNLGTLDRVTTERLLAVLFDMIRRAGVQ